MRFFACHKFVNFIAKLDFPLLAVWTVATKANSLAASANVATVKREMSRLLILARETTATVVPISTACNSLGAQKLRGPLISGL